MNNNDDQQWVTKAELDNEIKIVCDRLDTLENRSIGSLRLFGLRIAPSNLTAKHFGLFWCFVLMAFLWINAKEESKHKLIDDNFSVVFGLLISGLSAAIAFKPEDD